MPSLVPPALSQLSGQFCQGRILLTRPWPSVTIGRCDPGPLSVCVRFQAISRGGIVNGPVSQLWRTSSSQYLLFGAVKWSNINHELFIEIDWKCSQITDHPGERGRGTLLTLKVTQSASVWCLMVIMHHWPLSPGLIVPDHDAVPDVESWLTPPSFLVAGLCRALLPWLALAAAQTLGFVTRLKTQQFLRELYRNNIYMLRWHHIISFGCICIWTTIHYYYYQSMTWIWIIPFQSFRNPHWSHDVAATLEHGEIFLKMKGNWNPRSICNNISTNIKIIQSFLSDSDAGSVMM